MNDVENSLKDVVNNIDALIGRLTDALEPIETVESDSVIDVFRRMADGNIDIEDVYIDNSVDWPAWPDSFDPVGEMNADVAELYGVLNFVEESITGAQNALKLVRLHLKSYENQAAERLKSTTYQED